MAEHSTIEWTEATWNPITGCSVVSPGCKRCYAMKLAGGRLQNHWSRKGLTRDSKAGPVWTGEVRFNEVWLDQPLRWKRPRMIFVCAHSDLFHENVPDPWIVEVYAMMAAAHWHTYQVLTKRSARMRNLLEQTAFIENVYARAARYSLRVCDEWRWPLRNVWQGVSAEDQDRANERIPDLLATPAAKRFVSLEPLLGPIALIPILDPNTSATMEFKSEPGKLHWVIVGGESGDGARPMQRHWAEMIVAQCKDYRANGPAVFVKQLGAAYVDHDNRIYGASYPIGDFSGSFARLRDKKGGDINEFPASLKLREMPV